MDPSPPGSPAGRPPFAAVVRWLAGFATVAVAAGADASVAVRVAERALQVWDVAAHTWRTPPGDYRVLVGRSVVDVRLATTVHVEHEEVHAD